MEGDRSGGGSECRDHRGVRPRPGPKQPAGRLPDRSARQPAAGCRGAPDVQARARTAAPCLAGSADGGASTRACPARAEPASDTSQRVHRADDHATPGDGHRPARPLPAPVPSRVAPPQSRPCPRRPPSSRASSRTRSPSPSPWCRRLPQGAGRVGGDRGNRAVPGGPCGAAERAGARPPRLRARAHRRVQRRPGRGADRHRTPRTACAASHRPVAGGRRAAHAMAAADLLGRHHRARVGHRGAGAPDGRDPPGPAVMDTSLAAALGIGFLLGIRHATDADHVAAVSTFVSQHRSVARSCLLGTFWGVGHTAALLAAALATIAFKLTISPETERGLERVVALVLVLLGGHVLLRTLAPVPHAHAHVLHAAGRPFLVGLLHGLAGSAALTLAVVAAIPDPLAGLLYVLVFGAGSTVGMLVLSGLIALPFVVTANRARDLHTAVRALAGIASLLLGLWLLWELG